MIKMVNVSKKYSNSMEALTNIDMEVQKGEFVFILGPSGAGKTTLLMLLYCEVKPTAGKVIVDGKELNNLKSKDVAHLRRRMGIVFQDFRMINSMTVFENVALTLEVMGMRRKEVRKRVLLTLEWLGLVDKMNLIPLQLSGGEQQKVAIARAIVGEPVLLLGDEPTGNLDGELSADIVELFKKVNIKGTTVLFATNKNELVEKSSERAISIEKGRIIQN